MLNALLMCVKWSGYEVSVARKKTTLVSTVPRWTPLLSVSYALLAITHRCGN